MKRCLQRYGVCIFLILLFLSAFCCSVSAEGTAYAQSTENAQAVAEEIYDELNTQATEMLSELGLSEFSMDSVLALAPRKVIDALLGILQGAYRTPFRVAALLCAVSVLGALASSFFTQDSKIQTAFDMCSVLIATCILACLLYTSPSPRD